MELVQSLLLRDYFILFLVIGLGIAIGKIKLKGISFDLSAVIFVAIFLGYLYNVAGIDFKIPPIIQSVGLVLFIYTIGMQAGPSFFNAFKEQGVKLILLAGITVVSGGVIAFVISAVYGVEMNMITGLLTGALTSTPGLAAAIEASKSPMASIGYGIAYPFGVLGVILFVKLSPKFFRVQIAKEEQDFTDSNNSFAPPIGNVNLRITNENIHGKTVGELKIRSMTKANISRVMKPNQAAIAPTGDTVLEKDDMVKVVGTDDALTKVEVLLGVKTDQKIPRSGNFEIKWFIVSNKDVVNKTIRELNLMDNYVATITRIRRTGIDLVPYPNTRLRYGDKLLISCSKGNVPAVVELFGDSIKRVSETSFLPVAFGIAIGIFLGSVSIPLGGFHFKLGLTGGVLLTSLFFSWKGKTGSIVWNLPSQANTVLRQLGLLMFLTPVGLKAGQSLVSAIQEHGVVLFLYGALITLIPMLITVIVGKFAFKLNFLSILGALTGGMTSTPGLSATDTMTDSEAPQIAYASVYPFALVLIIVVTEVLSAI